jgi:catalase
MMKNPTLLSVKKTAIITMLLTAGAVSAEDKVKIQETPLLEKPTVEQIVDTLTKLSGGPHAGYRANHAKGIVVQGEFVPASSAASLTKAEHLQSKASPVVVRFSNATGVPTIPDANGNAFPKGIAVRFQLEDGRYTDIVSISTNGFPASNPEDFLGLLNAVAATGPDAPKPSPIEQFLGTHPAAMHFVQMPKLPPASFATQPFYGVNAFKFINAAGKSQYARYRITPVNGPAFLTKEQAAAASPDYLFTDLPKRLSDKAVQFTLSAQLAEPGDAINDATKVWPEDRKQVVLGTISLKQVKADGVQFEKATMFNPLALVDGIEASEDPILLARPTAYAVSYGRRLGQ